MRGGSHTGRRKKSVTCDTQENSAKHVRHRAKLFAPLLAAHARPVLAFHATARPAGHGFQLGVGTIRRCSSRYSIFRGPASRTHRTVRSVRNPPTHVGAFRPPADIMYESYISQGRIWNRWWSGWGAIAWWMPGLVRAWGPKCGHHATHGRRARRG